MGSEMEYIPSEEASHLLSEQSLCLICSLPSCSYKQDAVGLHDPSAILHPTEAILCGDAAHLSNIKTKQLEKISDISIRTIEIPAQDHTVNQVPHSFNHTLY